MTKDDSEHKYGGEIVTTKSVTSIVLAEGGDTTRADVHNGDGDPYGHVCLFDWDDINQRTATKRAGNMPGISVVLESSEGSYHCWNLSVSDLKTTACRLVLQEDDQAHIRAGIKRAYWRIRFTPKVWNYSDEVYKPAPELVTITYNRTEKEQSEPHWNLAKALFDVPELPVEFDWVGDSLTEEEYETMTDKEKERFRTEKGLDDEDREEMRGEIAEGKDG